MERRLPQPSRHAGCGRRRWGVVLLAISGVCLGQRVLASVVAFVPGSPATGALAAKDRASRGVGVRQTSQGTSTETVPPEFSSEEEKEEFRYLTLTFLQRVQNQEDVVEEAGGEKATFNLEQFRALMSRLELSTSERMSSRLFDMIDMDNSGYVNKDELRVRLRDSSAISEMYSESLQNVGLTVCSALALSVGVGVFKGPASGFDFLTAYVVEDSLSVDNLFVFLLLFNYFKVPPGLQSYCLNLGVYGAVVLRALFIFIGLSAVKSFQPLLLFFAAFLIYASYSSLAVGDEEEEEEDGKPPEFVSNIIESLPTTDKFDGDKLVVKGPDGQWLATPLALCIIAVELCDVLFAVDSIPAVFAVTDDPLVVFGSNIAAILGLRSLYQVLSVAAQDLVYLEKSVAVVLGFVGIKLGLEVFGIETSSALSLGVILGVLGVGVGASLYEQNKEKYSSMFKKVPTSNFQKLLKDLLKLSGK